MVAREIAVVFRCEAETEAEADKLAEMVADEMDEQPDLMVSAIVDMQADPDPEMKEVTPQGALSDTADVDRSESGGKVTGRAMTHQAKVRWLDEIVGRGFDLSYLSDGGGVRVRCSQCEAAVINGVACHEAGCPNEPRARLTGEDEDED